MRRLIQRAVVGIAGAGAAVMVMAGPAQAATTVASWGMGDSGSSMADSSGHKHTGTLHHVSVGQSGKSGKAFGFSGKPSYVSVPASKDFSPGTSNLRVQLSVRFSSRPSSSVRDYDLLRMGQSATSGGDYKVEILQSGRAFCEFRGSAGAASATGGPVLSDGRWHTIVCARTASSVTLTVDGKSYTTARKTGSITSSVTLYIGAKDGSGADQYSGYMDSVSISKG